MFRFVTLVQAIDERSSNLERGIGYVRASLREMLRSESDTEVTDPEACPTLSLVLQLSFYWSYSLGGVLACPNECTHFKEAIEAVVSWTAHCIFDC